MSARRLMLALLLAGGASACEAPSVPERAGIYPFTLQNGSAQLVMHWPLGARVRVAVAPGSAADANLRAGLDAGAAAWNAAALYGEYQLMPVAGVADADVVITGDDAPPSLDTSQCTPGGGGFGVTTFCLAADQHSLEVFPLAQGGGGHVKMLVTVLRSSAADAGNAARIVTHELGHVLGIARHSPVSTDLMFLNPTTAEPSAGDRATILALYHTPAQVVP